MKSYFLDTNVILDFIADRKPFSKYALALFKLALEGSCHLWTSDNVITTVYYIIEKEAGSVFAKEKIGLLLRHIEIQPITKADLLGALSVDFKDYEDGVQHAAALSHGKIDAIITRNIKDFKRSQLPVMSPEQLFPGGD